MRTECWTCHRNGCTFLPTALKTPITERCLCPIAWVCCSGFKLGEFVIRKDARPPRVAFHLPLCSPAENGNQVLPRNKHDPANFNFTRSVRLLRGRSFEAQAIPAADCRPNRPHQTRAAIEPDQLITPPLAAPGVGSIILRPDPPGRLAAVDDHLLEFAYSDHGAAPHLGALEFTLAQPCMNRVLA